MNVTKSMLLTVIYSLGLAFPALAIADTDDAAFQAEKERQIAIVLEKVQIAQRNLSCVQAAQDHAALKACDEAFKQSHDGSGNKEQVTDKKPKKDLKEK